MDTIYSKHIRDHPEYLQQMAMVAAYRNHPRARGHLPAMVEHQRANMVHPSYTCPTCRINVKHRPVEIYAFKDIIRAVSKISGGEESPKNGTVNRAAVGGVFDGFFPLDGF